jgi:hypothetical protein
MGARASAQPASAKLASSARRGVIKDFMFMSFR